MPKYDFYKGLKYSSRPEIRKVLDETFGKRDTFVSAKDVAEKVGKTIDSMGLVAFNNRTTWPKNVSVEKIVPQYTKYARAFDLEEEWAQGKAKLDSAKDWHRDFGLLATLVPRNSGGCCDDLAALAFCLVVQSSSPCAVSLVQVEETHSLVLVSGNEDWPWVIDAWTNPITVISLQKLTPNRICDQGLRFHVAEVDKTEDLTYEWSKLLGGVPKNLDKNQDEGPREQQARTGR